MSDIANSPEPPYIAVIFTNILDLDQSDDYAQTADDMVALAEKQDGYLGHESARDEQGVGITVSYWSDEKSIKKWKAVSDHQAAQKAGRQKWYRAYKARIATVTREYEFQR